MPRDLAGGLAGLRRFQEAEPLDLGAYDRLAAKLGSDNRFTLVALDRVIEIYEAWGQADKAADFRARRPPAEDAEPG